MYKRIINSTFYPVFENKFILMKALFLPLLSIIVLSELILKYHESGFIVIFLSILTFLLNITIAITTHRILLLGQDSIPPWGLFKFGGREFSFLITSIAIGLTIGVVVLFGAIPMMFMPESIIPQIILVIAVFFATVFFSRLSLALPSIAINKEISISDAWDYTKNYKLLTYFTIVIFPTIFTIILGIGYQLAIGFLIKVISPKLNILYPVLDVFITVFIVSALSATYKVIKEDHPEYFEKITRQENDALIINNKNRILVDTKKTPLSFEIIKNELIKQYEELGFTNTIVDKEDSWMIKNPEIKNAYVSLSFNKSQYKVEAYNIKEADLNLFSKEKEV
ncbi:hypothetical protein [Arcobacter sp. LA11]|uniref:hypothetical protein n=1 Tax=Arcobacter sp. LA11 TaxID=1898176 RepID=UPI00093225B6|nr:hypothetical protein [Arcobacter sp. LA11]